MSLNLVPFPHTKSHLIVASLWSLILSKKSLNIVLFSEEFGLGFRDLGLGVRVMQGSIFRVQG